MNIAQEFTDNVQSGFLKSKYTYILPAVTIVFYAVVFIDLERILENSNSFFSSVLYEGISEHS